MVQKSHSQPLVENTVNNGINYQPQLVFSPGFRWFLGFQGAARSKHLRAPRRGLERPRRAGASGHGECASAMLHVLNTPLKFNSEFTRTPKTWWFGRSDTQGREPFQRRTVALWGDICLQLAQFYGKCR